MSSTEAVKVVMRLVGALERRREAARIEEALLNAELLDLERELKIADNWSRPAANWRPI